MPITSSPRRVNDAGKWAVAKVDERAGLGETCYIFWLALLQ